MQHVNKDILVVDKEILYNMISREVDNYLKGIPIFGMFSPTIASWIIAFIDPYIDAFTGDNNTINTKQLTNFVSKELEEKINKFKAEYVEEVEERAN